MQTLQLAIIWTDNRTRFRSSTQVDYAFFFITESVPVSNAPQPVKKHMLKHNSLLGLIVWMLAGQACVPNKVDYVYIALDSRVMSITELGMRSRNDEPLRGHSKMPVRYELEREKYVLRAIVDDQIHTPALFFELQSKLATPLYIRGIPISCFGSFVDSNKMYKAPEPLATEVMFVWGKWADPNCDRVENSNRRQGNIVISVLDSEGSEVGRESIPFSLETNGYYIEIDAI